MKNNNVTNSTALSRRQFLRRGGVLVGGILLGAMTGCRPGITSVGPPSSSSTGLIYSPDTLRSNRIPPGQRQVVDWPVLQAGSVQHIELSSWSLHLYGLVANEVTLSYTGFTALPQVKVFSDIHCVTTWSLLDNTWEGASAKSIADLAMVKPEAGYVIAYGAGGFTTNLTLEDFLQEDVLLASRHNEDSLSAEHGGPVRLVIPRLYFWKSAKWLTALEFTAEDHPGLWETAGYNNHGDPWQEERYAGGGILGQD